MIWAHYWRWVFASPFKIPFQSVKYSVSLRGWQSMAFTGAMMLCSFEFNLSVIRSYHGIKFRQLKHSSESRYQGNFETKNAIVLHYIVTAWIIQLDDMDRHSNKFFPSFSLQAVLAFSATLKKNRDILLLAKLIFLFALCHHCYFEVSGAFCSSSSSYDSEHEGKSRKHKKSRSSRKVLPHQCIHIWFLI